MKTKSLFTKQSVIVYFFGNGPGGTATTFLFNALLDYICRSRNITVYVASSDTAPLLLKGSRTASSAFKVPLDIFSTTICDITPRSPISKLVKRS